MGIRGVRVGQVDLTSYLNLFPFEWGLWGCLGRVEE